MIIPAKVAYAIGVLVTTFFVTTPGVVDGVFESVFRIRLTGHLRMLSAPLRIPLGLFMRQGPILHTPITATPILYSQVIAPIPPPTTVAMPGITTPTSLPTVITSPIVGPVLTMTMDLIPYPTVALTLYKSNPLVAVKCARAQFSVATAARVFTADIEQVTSLTSRSYPTAVLTPRVEVYPATDTLAMFSFLGIIWILYILAGFVRKGRGTGIRIVEEVCRLQFESDASQTSLFVGNQ